MEPVFPQELFFEQELSVWQDGCVPQEALAVPPQRLRPVAGELAQRVREVPQDEDLEQVVGAALLQEASALLQEVFAVERFQRFRPFEQVAEPRSTFQRKLLP